MEYISLSEICRLHASCCAVVISTPIMGRIRASSQPCGRRRLVHVSLLFRSGNRQVRMFG